MRKLFLKIVMPVMATICVSVPSFAQDKLEASVGADLVSNYIWRGQDLGGVSLQPSVGISWKGISLSAWGSTGFNSADAREFDLTLGYGIEGFSVSVTDYWFTGGAGYFHYASPDHMHTFEAQVGYDFGFLAINWYTNFAGNVGYNAKGNKAYASYFTISAPFSIGPVNFEAAVGATPWGNDFYNGKMNRTFSVCEVGLTASKDFTISDSFSFGLFTQLVFNPSTEGAHLVVGLSF